MPRTTERLYAFGLGCEEFDLQTWNSLDMYEESQKQILLLAFSQELLKLCYILRIKFGNFWKMTPHELRKRPSYFPLYWLFNRDPKKVAIPTCTQCVIPYILCPKQPGCFCFTSLEPEEGLGKGRQAFAFWREPISWSYGAQVLDSGVNWVQTGKVEGKINKRDEERDVESRIHIVDDVSCCIWFFAVALFFYCFRFQEQNSMRTIWHIICNVLWEDML